MPNRFQHVFVLMLENRSFDYLLGYCSITGIDSSLGGATQVNGLNPLALRPAIEAFQVDSLGGIVVKEGRSWPLSQPLSVRQLLTSNLLGGTVVRRQGEADYAM